MNIKIPTRYEEILNSNIEWRSLIDNLIKRTESYFMESPYFFPEYTWHGVNHINNVLEISDKLIVSDSLEKLKPISIAVLIASIIIHDIGMYVKKDGLKKLIFGEYNGRKDEILDKNSWDIEWENYLKKVKRYSEKKLLNVFGISEPINDLNDLESELLNEKDKKIYGEFIRQNHHRLAHEIILYGFPGTVDRNIMIDEYYDIVNLIGIVARSHGMNIRDTEKYLQFCFGGDDNFKYPLDIPVYYLMILLRLADYLDAGLERAPIELSDSQKAVSYISQNEWRWNQTLSYQQCYRWDYQKKKINIHARPKNNIDFIGVEDWLNNIQKELDNSWACLSEYYFNELSLTVHRITSNIFDENVVKVYESKFLTQKVNLKVEPEIAKLLVKPLYNGNKSYAVRELLQNAVDACNERELLEVGNSNYIGEVKILINIQDKIFKIIDNGIGMNKEILLNYYLTVGASYRYSENWNALNIDEYGRSKVTRTGKFGIGVMSSFLLGNKITVITQYINEENGYKTEFSLESNNIQVERIQRSEGVGTSIEIEMDDSSAAFFMEKDNGDNFNDGDIAWYDWYHFRKPKVIFFVDSIEVYKINDFVPDDNWFNVNCIDFISYKYSYERFKQNYFCNGIIIPFANNINFDYYGMRIKQMPSISIIDQNDNLNIDLKRDKFIIPEIEKLVENIYKRIIYQLVNVDNFIESKVNFIDGEERILIYSEKGYTLFDPAFISTLAEKNIIIILDNFNDNFNLKRYKKYCKCNFREFSNIPICCLSTSNFGVIKKSYDNFYTKRKKTYEYLYDYYKQNKIKTEKSFFEWKDYWKCTTYVLEIIYKNVEINENNLIVKLLKKYLPDGWIPYDKKERVKVYPDIFNEFEN